jgi:uncharacterized membrane protein YfcA
VGFLIGGLLGALGGGGSVLAVPVLVFIAGQEPSAATTTSLLVVGAASVVGAVGHHRQGRVRIGPGLLFGSTGIGGSVAGSALNRRLDGDVLLLAFSALVLIAAWRIVTGCLSCARVGEPGAAGGDANPAVAAVTRTPRRRRPAMVAAGTFVGLLTGLFGVGGGFVIVPTLTLVLGFAMPEAIGTSLVVIAVNTAFALAARLGGPIDWGTSVLFAAAAIPGVAVGTRVADRLDAAALQRLFAALLVAVALYTGGRAAAGIW